jgi:uncharacterized protein
LEPIGRSDQQHFEKRVVKCLVHRFALKNSKQKDMNYQAARAYIVDRLGNHLSGVYSYHSLEHTLDVWETTRELCRLEQVPPYDTMLLLTAALYHDAGFLVSNTRHEEHSCSIVHEILPGYGYSDTEVTMICSMIMATKIPQSPQSPLEQILCDADLDYLGRHDFYTIGQKLFEELKSFRALSSVEEWNRLQVAFLEKHAFFTPTNRRRRNGQKEEYLEALRQLVASYDPV